MNSAEFGKALQTLFFYGLHPTYWEGDLFIVEDHDRRKLRMSLAGETSDEIPGAVPKIMLDHIGMEEGTFWQLYETL